MAVYRSGQYFDKDGNVVTNAQVECTLYGCRSKNVEEIDEKVPSGQYNKIKCDNGHVTHGIPIAEFRNTLKYYKK